MSFHTDKITWSCWGASLLINIIHWLILASKIGSFSDSTVLHYNVIYGADLVSSARLIYAIPAASLLILILNILAAAWLVRREKLAAYFLNFSNIAIQAVFFAASLSLIAFND